MGEAVFCRGGVDLGYDGRMDQVSQPAVKALLSAAVLLMAAAMVAMLLDTRSWPTLDWALRTLPWQRVLLICSAMLAVVLMVDWLKRRLK